MSRSRALARFVLLCLMASGVVTLTASPASAATLVVPSVAFPTIQSAVDGAAVGDTIKVKPGVYDENVVVTTNDVTIRGTDQAKVIIDGFDAAVNEPTLNATATNVQFDNMTVRNGEARTIFCTGDGCTITNIVVPRSVNDDCIDVVGNDAVIENNRLRACGTHGVEIIGNNARVVGNDSRLNDSDCYRVDGDDALVKGNIARNCEDGDGFIVSGDDNEIIKNQGLDIANECFDITGISPRVHKNTAGNCDNPFEVRGENMVVSSNVADRSGDDDGFRIVCFDETGGAPLAGACDDGVVKDNFARGTNDDDEGFDIDVDPGTGSFEVIGNTAVENNDEGFELDMDSAVIKDNIATANGSEDHEGMEILGDNNIVSGNVSKNNGGDGFKINGDANTFSGNLAKGNAIDGIHVEGDGNVISGNTAKGHEADGIENDDSATLTDFTDNVSSGNQIDCANDGTTDAVTGNDCADGSDFTVASTDIDGS